FKGIPVRSREGQIGWFDANSLSLEEMWEDDRYWSRLALEGRRFEGWFYYSGDFENLVDYQNRGGPTSCLGQSLKPLSLCWPCFKTEGGLGLSCRSLKLIECVPNFSEGRRQDVIRAIADAIKSTPAVTLLDVESNPDHNRSVISF